MNFLRKSTGILVVSALVFSGLRAQDRNAVIQVFNEGVKSAQTDVPAAIKSFENVIVLADKAGESCADLKQKAISVLPGLYNKVALAAINEKKPVADVMKAAKASVAAAGKYGNATQKDNASKVLVSAYNVKATAYFTANDYPNALASFDSLLAINPDYLNAIYNKALIYIKQNNSSAFEQDIDLFISKVKAANDEAKVKQASTLALEYFRSEGSKANQAEKLDEALELLNKAAKYGEDKELNYFFADVFNKQKNFDKGLEYAQKGLSMEAGDAAAKAKFYFQMGLAQEGKGLKDEACASFKNALFGPFATPAKAKRTNLKCQ